MKLMPCCNTRFHQQLDGPLLRRNKLPLPSSQCVVWCCPGSSSCWGYLNFQSPWILSRAFPSTPVLFLQPYYIAHQLAVALPLLLFSTMSFSLCRPYSIFSIVLLYNKEAVSRKLCSLSVSASRVAATGHFIWWGRFNRWGQFI